VSREPRVDTRTWRPAPDGVVVVDKPAGWTSHDVVGKIRYLARTRKVGHAGTLDPMATGVLVVGVGRATRLLTYVVGTSKEYVATVRLGETTVTDDAEGDRVATGDVTGIDREAVLREVTTLTGEILQVPTAVSAVKVDGVRAYARVRAGEDVVLEPRRVTVSRFDVLDLRAATTRDGVPVVDVDVEVTCSSGTYVRALARDLGAALGCGGHLTRLRRTRVGGFGLPGEGADLGAATSLDELERRTEAEGVLPTIPLAQAAAAVLPVRRLDEEEARGIVHGQAVSPTGQPGPHAALAPDGGLVAVVEDARRHGSTLARPVVVLASPDAHLSDTTS